MTVGGVVCNNPIISLVYCGSQTVRVCKFVVGMEKSIGSGSDCLQCVAFDDMADKVKSNYVRGAKIILSGQIKNHIYSDGNGTKHFTNVLLVESAEFGDSASAMLRFKNKKNIREIKCFANMVEALDTYDKLCAEGYLVIDEDLYYNLATEYRKMI